MPLPSFVTADPAMMLAAAEDLASIGAAMSAANSGAAGPTAGVVPAAADPVSALTGPQFTRHAGHYQAAATTAAAMHSLLVGTLHANATSYELTEAANSLAAG
jgi:PE family protein